MALPLHVRSPICLAKRLRVGTIRGAAFPIADRTLCLPSSRPAAGFVTAACSRQAQVKDQSRPSDVVALTVESEDESRPPSRNQDSLDRLEQGGKGISDLEARLPRSVQAVYLRPLKRQAKYGVPACDLQLRSYSVRNVEFFADFALRAAYYLNLPAAGPIPLPRITERWTVPRSNFIHKKSQENFERITLRRLIQIQDGHPETVEIWLAFLRKHAYYGVGMKANVWEYEKLGVGKTMDVSLENMKKVLEPKWAHFGRKKIPDTAEKVLEMLRGDRFKNSDDGPFNNA